MTCERCGNGLTGDSASDSYLYCHACGNQTEIPTKRKLGELLAEIHPDIVFDWNGGDPRIAGSSLMQRTEEERAAVHKLLCLYVR